MARRRPPIVAPATADYTALMSATPMDRTPAAFTFTDVTDAELSTSYESNSITVAGINRPSPLTITGGEYQINGAGDWFTTHRNVKVGDTVKVRATSSAEAETAVNVVLTIGGVSDTFTITTPSEGGGGEPGWLTDLQVPGGGDLPTHAASFADEEYWDGGEAAVADLFTGISVVAAGGLSIDGANSNNPVGSAGVVALLASAPWVAFFQFTLAELNESEMRTIFSALSAGQTQGIDCYIEPDGDDQRKITISAYAGGYDNAHSFSGTGVHKLAVRFDGSDVTRASLNGSTITVASPGSTPFTVGEFYLGDDNGSGWDGGLDKNGVGNLFEVVAFYPDQTQSDMNAMTALP